ncbi:hypothetical protein H6G36_14405 [Anabaena minutissima FACHB-250]|nr:hypothetical protein [Anabaena minutissima FACHB-250]
MTAIAGKSLLARKKYPIALEGGVFWHANIYIVMRSPISVITSTSNHEIVVN